MCGSMVDIQSPTGEIRRVEKEERKKERKKETTAAKYNVLPITMGGHKKVDIGNIQECAYTVS